MPAPDGAGAIGNKTGHFVKREAMMNEKIFKGLGQIGASGIVIGIIVAAVGVTAGVLSIVSGARALNLKKKIMI